MGTGNYINDQVIVGLRAMADFIEKHDDLPRVYGFSGQIDAESPEHLRELMAQFNVPMQYDHAKAMAAEVNLGPVGLTFYYPKPAVSQ